MSSFIVYDTSEYYIQENMETQRENGRDKIESGNGNLNIIHGQSHTDL